MSTELEKIVNMEGQPAEPEVNILREPVTVDLEVPVTVDGVTYSEMTFNFAGLKGEEIDKLDDTWHNLNPDIYNPVPLDQRDYQELYLVKASGIPLIVFRSLDGADKKGIYGLALEWLGKASVKKKRRKRNCAS
jgi:hypothetical protein